MKIVPGHVRSGCPEVPELGGEETVGPETGSFAFVLPCVSFLSTFLQHLYFGKNSVLRMAFTSFIQPRDNVRFCSRPVTF